MKLTHTFLVFLLIINILQSQTDSLQPPNTPAEDRLQRFEQRQTLIDNSLVSKVPFRSVGPMVFGGRITDFDVWEKDPTHFYAAYASGGLWKTENNGTTFEPIFDNEAVMTIGDIAVDWDRNIIWVGTGEVNSSRSSYSGVGLYRSADGGKSWQHKGLPESHHIGRIVLHPDDPNTLWVAVLGHLYSPNPERGVYKTTDGGNTWQKILFIDENTGAVDLVMDSENPEILYAAVWQRKRRAWNLEEAGENSGIWKSTNGGENWTQLTTLKSGFPTGKGVGRIGLVAAKGKNSSVLYAFLDNQNRRPKKERDKKKLTKDDLRKMSREDFLKLEEKHISQYLNKNRFPKKYDVEEVIRLVKEGTILPNSLAEYLDDANSLLFDTPVIGAEVYRSDDGGTSWKKTHEDYLDDIVFSYGYYFGLISISPQNPEEIYLGGVPVLKSTDGGKTFENINGNNVHVDHHALWINPNRKGHLILGNDGGINISYDDGKNWIKIAHPPVGQFYTVAVDMKEPYNVYGGTQDNGVWVGPNNYKANVNWEMTGQYPFKRLIGGDGMQVAIDSRDYTVYTGYQFGNYFRFEQDGKSKKITPKHELGERPFRWNWESPIHLSIHNEDIFYFGSNKLHRSLDRGETWEAISDDLTKGGIKGDVPYGTLTNIHESPLKFGLIYIGSDDGEVWMGEAGGYMWSDISEGLPENMWVSKIQASQHKLSRVYVSLNGYRWDNFESMLFVSENYGKSWQQIGKDLPMEPVNVVKEDPEIPDLIYVGTDHGLYISLDRGQNFMAMKENLPAVPVHDLVIHPREKDLVVGTHGRSIYIADVDHIQQLVDSILNKQLFVFDLENIKWRSNWGEGWLKWTEPREPELTFPIFCNSSGEIEISLFAGDLELKIWKEDLSKGLNYPIYNLEYDRKFKVKYEKWLNEISPDKDDSIEIEAAKNDKFYLRSGTYKFVFKKGEISVEKKFVVEALKKNKPKPKKKIP